ncbi:MAG: ATP-binding protein [Clostridia bacterium]|nr:ATP-binding protein [Clostridia bacterium]
MIVFEKNKETKELEALASNKISDELTGKMLAIAEKYCITGNLSALYAAYLLAMDTNTFSLACEKNKSGELGSIEKYALADAVKIYSIYVTADEADVYVPSSENVNNEDCRAGKLISALADKLIKSNNAEEILKTLKEFYTERGSGIFALYRGYTVTEKGELCPVMKYSDATFDGIYGYERHKKLLCENTEAFIEGKKANNALLYGDSGTGKSTSVKALLNKYHGDGLRMIGIQKHQFSFLPSIISDLSLRNYKFVLYLDDLSFENFETEYKYLKAIIEGGVAEKPENIIIYATSNRRHLVKETFEEREGGGDLHRAETTNEKVSLSERFGLQIYYAKPDRQEYIDMVLFLGEKAYPDFDQDALISGANAWAVKHGGFSGRAAEQFIHSLSGSGERPAAK